VIISATGALLDFVVLAIAERGDAYGYALTQSVKDILGVAESTMYPVMRRLQTHDYLETYDVPFEGRNRRYYRLTESGKAALSELRESWEDMKRTIDGITKGSIDTPEEEHDSE